MINSSGSGLFAKIRFMDETPPIAPVPGELTVRTGTHVVVELLDDAGGIERLEFVMVPDQSADFTRGFLGEGTPLAKAILGKPAGSHIQYRQADIASLRILAVTPASSAPDKDVAQQREAAMRKAMADVERTNAILFASSFSGKWGDYDPSGMEHWEEKDE